VIGLKRIEKVMSKLRKHLDKSRREYQQAKYPGDLADELLRPAIKLSQWIAPIGLIAVAALVVVALNLHHATPTINEKTNPPYVMDMTQSPITTQPTEQLAVSTGGVPDFSTSDTSDMSFAPSGYTFSVSVPSFSLAEDDSSTQPSATTQATKETI